MTTRRRDPRVNCRPGFVGWLWARATIETRGLGVAVGLHVLQDLVIFTALLS